MLFCSGGFCGNERGRGGPGQGPLEPEELAFWGPVPSILRLQLYNGVIPPNRPGVWSFQNCGLRCLVQELIPHRCSFTKCSRQAVREEKATASGSGGPPPESLCASVSPSAKCRGYTRSSSPQPWDMEIFLGWTERALKAMVRGFSVSAPGSLRFGVPRPYSSLTCLNLPLSPSHSQTLASCPFSPKFFSVHLLRIEHSLKRPSTVISFIIVLCCPRFSLSVGLMTSFSAYFLPQHEILSRVT